MAGGEHQVRCWNGRRGCADGFCVRGRRRRSALIQRNGAHGRALPAHLGGHERVDNKRPDDAAQDVEAAEEWQRNDLLRALAHAACQRDTGAIGSSRDGQAQRQRQEPADGMRHGQRGEEREDRAAHQEGYGDVQKVLVAALRAVGYKVHGKRGQSVGDDG